MRDLMNGKWLTNALLNGGWLNSNVLMISLMGVLLLMASAVGRITATNLGNWLTKPQARIERTVMLDNSRLDSSRMDNGAAMLPYAVHKSR